MTALTTMFNFIIVYVRYFSVIVFGGSLYLNSFSGEQYLIAKNIFDYYDIGSVLIYENNPLIVLFVGVFVIGAIIGLARRLIRG